MSSGKWWRDDCIRILGRKNQPQITASVLKGFSQLRAGIFSPKMGGAEGPKWHEGDLFWREDHSTGQISSRPHTTDFPPNGGLVREIPLFQGNLGWWNIIIWPDIYIYIYMIYMMYMYMVCSIWLGCDVSWLHTKYFLDHFTNTLWFQGFRWLLEYFRTRNTFTTVDGWNPTPPGMYETL